MPHVVVGTAGHIDHGKTALVQALTGVDTDRLKEEKARGITIDLGFASRTLDSTVTLGFIDVPGHERFVKNMLAGVGGIDMVMLVVAADESVMPQTREHLDICSLLRIRSGLIALTKIDGLEPELVDLAELEVRQLVQRTFLAKAPVVRVSARTGEGIDGLVEALGALARAAPPRDPSQALRLPIDRAFTMKGFGTVVSGTMLGGRACRDDEVEILPGRVTGRVRGIQVHGRSVEAASAGERTAINLQRVALAEVERGMVLATPGVFEPTTLLDVHLELLTSAPGSILRRKRIRFHAGTAELMGQVVLLAQEALEPGGSGFAQIRLERPTVALSGDRFVVRQYSPMVTIGGGEILDPRPDRHRRSDRAVAERLAEIRLADRQQRARLIVRDARRRTVDVPELAGRLGLESGTAAAWLHALIGARQAQLLSDDPLVVVDAAAFDLAAAAVRAEVAQFHAREPLAQGIGRDALRERALAGSPPVLFRGVLAWLLDQRTLASDHDLVYLAGRAVTLDRALTEMHDRLASHYRNAGLHAATADEAIAACGLDPRTGAKVLQLLVKEGTVVKLGGGMLVDRSAVQRLIAQVRARKAAGPDFGVPEFKALTGLSRKYAVPLLEYLDAERVTRRVGDGRVIL